MHPQIYFWNAENQIIRHIKLHKKNCVLDHFSVFQNLSNFGHRSQPRTFSPRGLGAVQAVGTIRSSKHQKGSSGAGSHLDHLAQLDRVTWWTYMKNRWLITSTHRKVEKWVIENWHTPQSQWFIMSFPIKDAIQLEANPSLVGENHGRSVLCPLQIARELWRRNFGASTSVGQPRTPWCSCSSSQILSNFSVIFLLNPKFHPGLLIKSLPSGNFTLCYGKSQF